MMVIGCTIYQATHLICVSDWCWRDLFVELNSSRCRSPFSRMSKHIDFFFIRSLVRPFSRSVRMYTYVSCDLCKQTLVIFRLYIYEVSVTGCLTCESFSTWSIESVYLVCAYANRQQSNENG